MCFTFKKEIQIILIIFMMETDRL